MSKTNKFKVGFTLIELLVVVAIIGILSSVVLASIGGARESARDARRQQDIDQIQTAIQLYMNDNNGNPPLAGNDRWYASDAGDWRQLENELQNYVSDMPVDPVNNGALEYIYRAGGSAMRNECDFNAEQDEYLLAFAVESSDLDMLKFNSRDGYDRYCVIY